MTSTSWHSYPKLFNLGHGAIKNLLSSDVVVEEKIDGSQFSFGRFGDELFCRSKGKVLDISHPEKMFIKAVETAKELFPLLNDGWTYRGEYLQSPKHNTLAYDRHPIKYFILFDVNTGHEQYLSYEDKKREAERLGIEVVPLLFQGKVDTLNQIMGFMDRTSVLGGQKIEGIVIKNYGMFGSDGHALMGKHVSEEFKEIHTRDWKKRFPGTKDVVAILGEQYRTPARWNKAIQHMEEAGKLTNSPKDIGPLVKEVQDDILSECKEELMDQLFKWAWPNLQRAVIKGLPQWYKNKLAERQVA